MAASRDIPNGRPTSQHRQALGLVASSLPARHSYLRAHSHSVSQGSPNSAHRISRRKSSTIVNTANVAALAAAAKEPSYNTVSQSQRERDEVPGIFQSPKIPSSRPVSGISVTNNGSAVVDGPSLSSMIDKDRSGSKSRTRRASEGSRAQKERTKSNAGELKCETCGKGYKHGSCLTKHLWEHTPEWALTSKLLISKHQQVQLLEAASVLVQMNQDGPTITAYPIQREDDQSSESPAASGSSDPIDEDDLSSRTSTPSQDESMKPLHFSRRAQRDSYTDGYARSYQSTSTFATSAPNDSTGYPMYRQWSSSSRPSTAHGQSDDEPSDLAAAAQGLVNCSLGTSKFGSGQLPAGIPPVPPLPAKFIKTNSSTDVDMDADEEDDGIFGTMEQ